jgi:3(or 17)beta-hydroxysteroid dehydrogenase
MRLEGKVALVTGGGSGLGRAMCLRFAQEGAFVLVTDINAEAAQETVDQGAGLPGKLIAKYQDVCDESAWAETVAFAEAELGPLDILVNNAGIAVTASVEHETLEGWRKTQAVNLDAVFMGTQAGILAMKGRGGSIINLSSIEGIIGDPLTCAYNASKGGVRIFTKSAALWCCRENYGVRVNSIHPGFIEPPMVINAIAAMSEEDRQSVEAQLQMAIPMGEMGRPEDIANAALFLASDESRYMTGSELVVDGGYTAR